MATTTPTAFCSLGIKTEQPERFRCDTHCEHTLRRLQSRLDLCDVVLIVGSSGKRIAAHRFFLIACSEYFSDLFSGPSGVAQHREVTIDDINGDAMEKLINYCYTGCLDLEGDTIESLIITANHLRLEKAVQGCCEFLQRHLQSSNCLEIAFFAEQLKLESFLQSTRKFIGENFKEVFKQLIFCVHHEEQSELCYGFFATFDEFTVEVLTKWAEYEPESRMKYIPRLIFHMRLALWSHSLLLQHMGQLYDEVMHFKNICYEPYTVNDFLQPGNFPSKIAVQTLFAVIEKLDIRSCNLQTKIWTVCNSPLKRSEIRVCCALALIHYKLIIVGGESNSAPLNRVTILDLHTMATTEMELNLVEKFDSVRGTSILCNSMKEIRRYPSVAVLNNNFFEDGRFKCLESSYLTSAQCRILPPLPGRFVQNFTVSNGYWRAIDGLTVDEECPVQRYDPRTNTWTTTFCSPRFNSYVIYTYLGFGNNAKKIYMIGNEDIHHLDNSIVRAASASI